MEERKRRDIMDMTTSTISLVTQVVCNCCGNTTAVPLPHLSHFLHIQPPGQCVRCQGCGLVFVSPFPDQSDFYEEAYYELPTVGGLEDASSHLKQRLAKLEESLGHTGRFLDVGCSTGAFVAYAGQQGWDAAGVDVSRWATAQAQARGLHVAIGTLEEQHYPAANFDVVHSSHMLEHVPDPLRVLREMRRILKPDGLLSLEVPQEVERIYDRIKDRLGSREYPTDPSPHLYFFTARTLRRIIEKADFQVVLLRSRNPRGDWTRGKYPAGTAVKHAIFALEDSLKRGSNLEVLARPGGAIGAEGYQD
jgi:SAM-dependent methyltransferase